MNKKILLVSILFFSLVVTVMFAAADNVKVIVNNNVSQSSISARDLGNIFLGKKKSWDNGAKVVPVTLKSGQVHQDFLKAFVKKSASQFSTFWKQAIFTGQGLPPKSFSSEAEIVKFVTDNPGAVGYISADTPTDSVKVLAVN